MEIVHSDCIVLMQDHGRIGVRAREIVGRRANEDFLAQFHRERLHETAKSVNEIQLGARGEQELYLAVSEVVDFRDRSTYWRPELDSPQSFTFFILEYQPVVGLLREKIRLSCGAVLHLERSGRNRDGGILFRG